MTKCLLCNGLRSPNRKRYCSTICIKRAWYLRQNPNRKSYFVGNPEFWNTETGKGFKWEQYSAKFLGANHLEFNNSGADLDWKGKLVDVKSCNLYKRKSKRGKAVSGDQSGWWVFNRNKQKLIDYFFCIALKDNKPVKHFLIPSKHFASKGIVVGQHSKYDKFQV